MAFRAMGYWKSMMSRSFALTPKAKQFSTTTNQAQNRSVNKFSMTAENAPIYMVLGMVVVVITFATHTAKQNLMHAPGVVISKKKRESISEADNPDQTLVSAHKFLDKNFFRKIAHIQDDKSTLPNPTQPNIFSRRRTADSLKTVGIDSSRH